MSSLTEQERIGLEEVFLSISSPNGQMGKVQMLKRKIQHIFRESTFLTRGKKPARQLFQASKRIKFPNFQHLFPKKNKKKKNLS